MSKKNNKYQKQSHIQGEIEAELIEAQAKRKGHGDQRKISQRTKQLRQDFEYIAAISEARHAA